MVNFQMYTFEGLKKKRLKKVKKVKLEKLIWLSASNSFLRKQRCI